MFDHPGNSALHPHADALPVAIRLRGVRVHNLKSIDVEIPHGRLTVVCGPSGSGKSSLVMDTLHTEGQRRYIETLSVRTRQFLARLDRPTADVLDGIPAAIAMGPESVVDDPLASVGRLAQIEPHLRVLYSRLGVVVCSRCGRRVCRDTPEAVAAELAALPPGTKFLVAFPLQASGLGLEALRTEGFHRLLSEGRLVDLSDDAASFELDSATAQVLVDRLVTAGEVSPRWLESISLALRLGLGSATLLVPWEGSPDREPWRGLRGDQIQGIKHLRWPLSTRFRCAVCDIDYVEPSPRLFNPQIPLGACPACGGTGVARREGTPSRRAGRGAPISDLGSAGSPCPICHGDRLRPEALACRIANLNIAEFCRLPLRTAERIVETMPTGTSGARHLARAILDRLRSLQQLGLGHLTLERAAETLGAGELLRCGLTAALSSSLVRTLHVLDEPTSRLHPHDAAHVLAGLLALRDRGNTVVVASHDPQILRAADHVIELGPGGGADGGKVLFAGRPSVVGEHASTTPLDALHCHTAPVTSLRSSTPWGVIQLRGAQGGNLRHVDVDIPLGKTTVVTGVSGSGKSTLVERTLYPALVERFQIPFRPPLPFDALHVRGPLDGVLFLDQSPPARSQRATPGTYTKAWNAIREVYAATSDAKIRGISSRHFSLNVDAGRCETCRALGHLRVPMQFLPDVYVVCPACHGRRFRDSVLECRHRGRTIADVLDMTAREAFGFFRGQRRVQARLQPLLHMGLGYLVLGQALRTLSRGEWQRLRLATQLGQRPTGRTLIILDGPSAGLHPRDLPCLYDCLRALLAGGHTLLLVEENPLVVAAADHVIELGPGAGGEGGRVVATGPPDEIAQSPASVMGPHLVRLRRVEAS